MADFDALQKQRMEKDLQELQLLINKHFETRQKDDAELQELEGRIEKRKEERAEQMRVRQEREKERLEREKEEKLRREAEEEAKKLEEEERKKAAIAAMSSSGGNMNRDRNRNNRRQTDREKKRKALAERRKPLNVDHLTIEKLREKAAAMHKWLAQLEEEKYDFESVIDRQKYDVTQFRSRVADWMAKTNRSKAGRRGPIRTGKVK
jgi:chromosome segregation ATPase